MYLLLLFGTAFLIISIFSTNWPLKLYHHFLLKRLALELNSEPQRYGMLFSNMYSEIITVYRRKELRIRFIETSIDSLKANSGLEIRMKEDAGVVMELYRDKHKRKTWGDFQRFLTGDDRIDSEWFIITTDIEKASALWKRTKLNELVKSNPQLGQVLINEHEIIVQLTRYRSSQRVLNLLDQLTSCFA